MATEKFTFPQSPQSDLWALLTPEQRIETAKVFRHLKCATQIQLCYILKDYIEDAVIPEFQEDELLMSAAFVILTGYEMNTKPTWCIQPLCKPADGKDFDEGSLRDKHSEHSTNRSKLHAILNTFKKNLCI